MQTLLRMLAASYINEGTNIIMCYAHNVTLSVLWLKLELPPPTKPRIQEHAPC